MSKHVEDTGKDTPVDKVPQPGLADAAIDGKADVSVNASAMDKRVAGEDDPDRTVRIAKSHIRVEYNGNNQAENVPIMRFRNLHFVLARYQAPQKKLFARKEPILSLPVSQRSWWIKNPWQQGTTIVEAIFSVVCLLIIFVGATGAWYYLSAHTTSSHADSVQATTSPGILSGPTTPSIITAPVNGNALAAYQWLQQGTKQTIYIDTQHHLQYISSVDGKNWLQLDLTRSTNAPVASGQAICGYIATENNTQEIAYVDAHQHIELLQFTSAGHPTLLDLTQLLHAPLSNGVVLSGFDWAQPGTQQIVYIDVHLHVIELTSANGTAWHEQDLTALTGSSPANGSTLSGFVWNADTSQHIVYVDAQQHIIELRSSVKQHWQSQDITQTIGIPIASTSNLLGYQWLNTGEKIIDYVDQRHNIQELTSMQEGSWTLSNITLLSHQLPMGGTALTAFPWPQGGQRQIAFIDTSNHIQELSLRPLSQWTAKDLTLTLSPPIPAHNIIVGFSWSQSGTQQLIYLDIHQQPQELSELFGRNWQIADWRNK